MKIRALWEQPSGFNPNFPQYLLKVDIAKAAKLGVNLK